MTDKKSVKRALLLSVLATFMCVAMLIGTTFAWFTDTASTAVNKIQAGVLDIEVSFAKEAKNDDGTLKGELTEFKTIENATDVFDSNALWEPGRKEYIVFKIENKGNLALKYKFNLAVVAQKAGINVDNEQYFLSDYLCASAKIDEGPGIVGSGYGTTGTPEFDAFMARLNDLNMAGYVSTATPSEKPLSSVNLEGKLEKNAINSICMAVWMPETVGNEANALDSEHAASIDLGINVYATQDTVESDSFGNQYDKDAPYKTVNVSDEQELRTALYNAPTDGNGVKIVLKDDITLEMLYAAENFGTASINDYETGDTLNRYKLGVHPTADDPTHWNPLVTGQTQEEKEAYGAYFHTSAGDERIARLVVKAGQDVILDLNGHNLSKSDRATHGDWTVICTNLIGNYGTLSIIDSEGTGLITGNGFISCSGGVIHNFGGKLTVGDINIDGGAYEGTGQYTVVNGAQETPGECKNGTVVLDGTHIFDSATSASLICNIEGSLSVKGGAELRHKKTKVINVKGGNVKIEDAVITSDNYAVYIEKGNVTINGLVINGTGIIKNNGGTLTDNR